MGKRTIFLISFVLVLGAADYISAAVDANIPKTGFPPPVIDGIKEEAWTPSEEHPITNHVRDYLPTSPADCSGSRDNTYGRHPEKGAGRTEGVCPYIFIQGAGRLFVGTPGTDHAYRKGDRS